MHNPTRREIREYEAFLRAHLDDPAKREAQRAKALNDAQHLVKRRYGVTRFSSVVDYGMRWCIDTIDDRGYGIAGIITAEDGRSWDVRYHPATGQRRLTQTR